MHTCTTQPVAIEATGVKSITLAGPDSRGHRLAIIEGLPLDVDSQGRPRARDLDLATFLGFRRPRDVRQLIRRHEASGLLGAVDWRAPEGSRHGTATGSPHRGATGGHRPSDREAWLTEEQALMLAAKSETDRARAMLQAVVRVFVAVRHGLLANPTPVAPVAVDAARLDRLEGEVAELRTLVLGQGARQERPALPSAAARQEELRAAVLDVIRREPGIPGAEAIRGRVGRRLQAVGATIRHLVASGAVRNEGDTRRPRLFVAGASAPVCCSAALVARCA